MLSKYCYQQAIDERVDNLWRIHQNREKQGLGGTYNKMNLYDDQTHVQDRGFKYNNGLHFSID